MSIRVGLFDSGVGGLTVFKRVAKLYPHFSFIYLADTARIPYGSKNPSEINEIAYEIANLAINKIKNKKNTTFGCPSGRSLKKTYNLIGKLSYENKIDLSKVKIFMMDEYVLKRNNKFYLCNPKLHYSCVGFAHKVIKKLFNYKKANNKKLKLSNIFFPDVNNPKKYDKLI